MSKEVYQELLGEFRGAWCKYNDDFSIHIFSPGSVSSSPGGPTYFDGEVFPHSEYEIIAHVVLPFSTNRKITLDAMNSGLFGVVALRKNEGTAEGRETFRQLCGRAGAALPLRFREGIGGLCHHVSTDAASWWIALLVYLSGKAAFGPDGEFRGHVELMKPFFRSTEAIEECNLITDQPILPDWPLGSSESAVARPRQLADIECNVSVSPPGQPTTVEPTPAARDTHTMNSAGDSIPNGYPTPDNYERDKWIYKQRSARRTIPEIQGDLGNNIHGWEPLYSDNAIRDAEKRYANYHGLKLPKIKPGKPRTAG